jgi:hypothetical protein
VHPLAATAVPIAGAAFVEPGFNPKPRTLQIAFPKWGKAVCAASRGLAIAQPWLVLAVPPKSVAEV